MALMQTMLAEILSIHAAPASGVNVRTRKPPHYETHRAWEKLENKIVCRSASPGINVCF